jgi:hypothetical protein
MDSTETSIIENSSSLDTISEDKLINAKVKAEETKKNLAIILHKLKGRDNILNPFNYLKVASSILGSDNSYKYADFLTKASLALSNFFNYYSNINKSLKSVFGTEATSEGAKKSLDKLLTSETEVAEIEKEYFNFNLFGIRSATPKMDAIVKKIPTSMLYEIFQDQINKFNADFEKEKNRSPKDKKENPPVAKLQLTRFRNTILKHCDLTPEEKNEINKMFKEALVAKEGEAWLSSLYKPFSKVFSSIWPSKDDVKASAEVTSTKQKPDYNPPVERTSLTKSIPTEVNKHISSVTTQAAKSPLELDYKADILENTQLDKSSKYKLIYQHIEEYLTKHNKAFSPGERQDLNTALTSALNKFNKDTEQYKYLSTLQNDCQKSKLNTLNFKEFMSFGDLRR